MPKDGQVNPIDVTQALAAGARSRGGKVFENCKVTRILTDKGKATGVETDEGKPLVAGQRGEPLADHGLARTRSTGDADQEWTACRWHRRDISRGVLVMTLLHRQGLTP